MLLKKYYIIASKKFTRIIFDEDSMGMCARCYLTENCTCNSLSYIFCKKVNFDSLLYSERFKHAYVVEKT